MRFNQLSISLYSNVITHLFCDKLYTYVYVCRIERVIYHIEIIVTEQYTFYLDRILYIKVAFAGSYCVD